MILVKERGFYEDFTGKKIEKKTIVTKK